MVHRLKVSEAQLAAHRDCLSSCATRRERLAALREIDAGFTVRDEHEVLIDGDRVGHHDRRAQAQRVRIGSRHLAEECARRRIQDLHAAVTRGDERFTADQLGL